MKWCEDKFNMSFSSLYLTSLMIFLIKNGINLGQKTKKRIDQLVSWILPKKPEIRLSGTTMNTNSSLLKMFFVQKLDTCLYVMSCVSEHKFKLAQTSFLFILGRQRKYLFVYQYTYVSLWNDEFFVTYKNSLLFFLVFNSASLMTLAKYFVLRLKKYTSVQHQYTTTKI